MKKVYLNLALEISALLDKSELEFDTEISAADYRVFSFVRVKSDLSRLSRFVGEDLERVATYPGINLFYVEEEFLVPLKETDMSDDDNASFDRCCHALREAGFLWALDAESALAAIGHGIQGFAVKRKGVES